VTDVTFRVPAIFEYVATFAWAMSGAVVGIRKGFDLTGVFVIALLSATGGGLLRDAVFLQRTPAFLVSPDFPAVDRGDDRGDGAVQPAPHASAQSRHGEEARRPH
jgi:hypothetical protein